MSSMNTAGRIGVSLIIIAVSPWIAWKLWSSTRNWVPARVPLAIAPGSRTETKEFEVNISGPYEIAVEADRKPTLTLNQLACSLGAGPVWPEKACPTSSPLKLKWFLTKNDKIFANGSSEETHGGGTTADSATRLVGNFLGKRGDHYKLTAEALSDVPILEGTNPRLMVSVGGTIYEFNLVVEGFLRALATGIGAIGGILVVFSEVKRRKLLRKIEMNKPR